MVEAKASKFKLQVKINSRGKINSFENINTGQNHDCRGPGLPFNKFWSWWFRYL